MCVLGCEPVMVTTGLTPFIVHHIILLMNIPCRSMDPSSTAANRPDAVWQPIYQ